ncbi:MAG: leucyl aminopeptidase [Ulvibacter sp.]|jgi:leucyl aminopeptidase
MNLLLNTEVDDTPLIILDVDDFQTWLKLQEPRIHKWLTQSGYSGSGLALIPNAHGEFEQAIYIVENLMNYFSCGDIVHKLPVRKYSLQAEKKYRNSICFAWLVGSYQFNRYKKNIKELPILTVATQELIDTAIKYAEATNLTRDLINTPASDMMPENLAKVADELAEKFGAKVRHIVDEQLLEHNYPTIHAVGRASDHAPRLIDISWGNENGPKITLVGKGVCFDSGGLDIKSRVGMRLMKKDMGGAAHVLGLAQLIMAHNLSIRLRVLIPAVENAVSSNAFRPGDVITTREGITVEIDNTDAEGRLVLCDALSEANHDKPELLIDFATLTGAMRVALGTELPGFFSTCDEVAEGITKAGNNIDDPVWRMPLHNAYKSMLQSDIADMTNCPTSPYGGAIIAALYLQEFVNKDITWVHFDVMAFNLRHLTGRPTGGEAFGIRAVFDYLQQRYS